jgi:hypothetical protein
MSENQNTPSEETTGATVEAAPSETQDSPSLENLSGAMLTSKGGGYPAYQHYRDTFGAVYCTKNKKKSHAEGNKWIHKCIAAHPGTGCLGRPWLSQTQDGTIWS